MSEATYENVRDRLNACSDGEGLLADGFEEALIGTAEGWFGHAHGVVALYDLCRCVEILMSGGMAEDEATEWLSFNVTGAYAGPNTSVFAVINRLPIIYRIGA